MFKKNKSDSNKYSFIGFFILVCFFACHPVQKTTTHDPESFILEPKIPAGYTKVTPRAVDDSKGMLSQTATIFRGKLERIYFTYDECAGPRTNYIFSQTKTLIGSNVDSIVNLKIFGGPLPTGTLLNISELPQLAYDASYLIFLRNTDWTFSPIVGDLIFRHEVEDGKEILIDPLGHFVKGWNENGPILSTAAVSDPVGSRLYGSKDRDTTSSNNQNNFKNYDTVISKIFRVSKAQLDSSKRVKTNSGTNSDARDIHLPTMQDVSVGGMFQKPILQEIEFNGEYPISTDSLLQLIKVDATRSKIEIKGRLSLQPYWRCWEITPTSNGKYDFNIHQQTIKK